MSKFMFQHLGRLRQQVVGIERRNIDLLNIETYFLLRPGWFDRLGFFFVSKFKFVLFEIVIFFL